MKSFRLAFLLAATLTAASAFAQPVSKVKIGLVSTLSGPNGAIGEEIRDGGSTDSLAEERPATPDPVEAAVTPAPAAQAEPIGDLAEAKTEAAARPAPAPVPAPAPAPVTAAKPAPAPEPEPASP